MPRSLPDHPSLRYLKLEAKRRLADGEFGTLHDAQAAVAREHGEPSWAALKRLIESLDSHALAQLRWLASRFAQAGRPGWSPPGDAEMGEHFTSGFLSEVPAAELTADLSQIGAALGTPYRVLHAGPFQARIELAGLDIGAAVENGPPHRITGLRAMPAVPPVTEDRLTAPPVRVRGDVPDDVRAIAAAACAELGAAGIALAGGQADTGGPAGAGGPADTGGPAGAGGWVVTAGWRDLDRGEVLDPAHRFPATGVSVLATATAVLRLVADGAVGLDEAANAYLDTVRLADDAITVRDLLGHTGGVDGPATLFGPSVPALAELTGPVIACPGRRGAVRPSNGGIAALGQLIADVTGESFAAAVTRLVLQPLGMTRSWFPADTAGLGGDAVTGYEAGPDGRLRPLPAVVCTIPAVGGLWAPPGDLLTLATGWASLLPPELARATVTPAASGPDGHWPGLGWLLRPDGVAFHGGTGPGCTAAIELRPADGSVLVALASRMVPVDPVLRRLGHVSPEETTS